MLRRVVTLFPVLLGLVLVSCAPKNSEVILAELNNGTKVTSSEFEKAYLKNTSSVEPAKTDSVQKLKTFLDLYVNFKMKIEDAKAKGYEDNNELKAELADYERKVGVSYLLEKEVVEPGIKQLYERRKEELRLSHIMIRVDSTGETAASAYANKLLDSIKTGKRTFEQMVAYTHDSFSKDLKGDLFYVTAGMLPKEFDDASYSIKPGEVFPSVVKTKYGYHIIKVTERQPRIPNVKAAHILVDYLNEFGDADSAGARLRADSVLQKIKAGESFSQLASKYSDDPGSKNSGGELGFFERRQMIKEFDEAVFKLKPGEVSGIIQTDYGFHIIKSLEQGKIAAFEAEKENLKKLYKQNGYDDAYAGYISKLKSKYNLQLNFQNVADASKSVDTVTVSDAIPAAAGLGNKVAFTYDDKSVSVEQLVAKAKEAPEYQNRKLTKENLTEILSKKSVDFLLEEEATELKNTNAEFAALMGDYKNGIYIFKLLADEIWNKIKLDSASLSKHYELTKENYKWGDRASFTEIFSRKDSVLKKIAADISSGKISFDSAAVKYTERPGYKEKGGKFVKADVKTNQSAAAAFKLNKEGDFTKEPVQINGGYALVSLIEKDPARTKTFEEARAEVSGSFQEVEQKRLEEEYQKTLKNRYQPVVKYENLDKLFKSEN